MEFMKTRSYGRWVGSIPIGLCLYTRGKSGTETGTHTGEHQTKLKIMISVPTSQGIPKGVSNH